MKSRDIGIFEVLRHIHPLFGFVYLAGTARRGAVYTRAFKRGLAGGAPDPGPFDLGESPNHALRHLRHWYRGYSDGFRWRVKWLGEGWQLPSDTEQAWKTPIISEDAYASHLDPASDRDPRALIATEEWERLRKRYLHFD